ncbi:hypothetical protein [Sphingomonas sp. AX6]|uniref:hypothetical protein n=1 Tax=Sphingomonas sp. AX6 TaxID=2653171 RepID=UPI0012F02BEC|nr:hypothetical protein [Sphingomonas sp. AX6]VXC41289.1 conserved exported hypothetical protein [Sphingomonas sp. AX6]
MRILSITSACIALSALPAAAQTSNPIQTIDLPPSVSVASDPFARVEGEAEVEGVETNITIVDDAAPVEAADAAPRVTRALVAGAEAVGDTGTAVAGDVATAAAPDADAAAPAAEAEESAVGRVDAIMEVLLGPSEEEQRAVAAKLYAEQAERHRLEMQRAETLNREARERVEAENTRRLAEYRAEVERINADHAEREQARMADWQARVVACEAGDRSACGQ